MADRIWCCRRPELDDFSYKKLKTASEFSAVFGILLNISSSLESFYKEEEMKENKHKKEPEQWLRSFFQLIHDLIKYDLSSGNRVFALASGGLDKKPEVDILRTFEKFKTSGCHNDTELSATEEHIEQFFSFVKDRGARTIQRWVTSNVISDVVKDVILIVTLYELKSNRRFRNRFINEILPKECRDWGFEPTDRNPLMHFRSFFANCAQTCFARVAAAFRPASHEDVHEVVEKTLPELAELPSKSKSVLSVDEALPIVDACLKLKNLNHEAGKNFYREIVFYEKKGKYVQENALCRTLKTSLELFSSTKYSGGGVSKVLFILSDGSQSDMHSLEQIKKKLTKQEVTIICCYLSESRKETCPKCFFSQVDEKWCDGAKVLFNLSSYVPKDILPRAILLNRGWDIDIMNDETRLFMEVNNFENVKEACKLVQDIACCHEALSDFLSLAYLDFFIDSTIHESQEVPEQTLLTCYANACATVLCSSLIRIFGPDKSPRFEDLRKEMISIFGTKGAYIDEVLNDMCQKYPLQYRKVDLHGALRAITEKRPVVTTFYLRRSKMNAFAEFYNNNPLGILTKEEITGDTRRYEHAEDDELVGHAVVLTSFNSQCLILMNSWGEEWGDKGFFRVESADVLGPHLDLIDVYWKLNDLSKEERENHKRHDAIVARKLWDNLNGLQKQKYKCPRCKEKSPVHQFSGTKLFEVVCPKCKRPFLINTKEGGNLLALNMYLLTLTR